jgi:hypothetical protein
MADQCGDLMIALPRACFAHVKPQAGRHGRTCSGHPRLARGTKDVDARDISAFTRVFDALCPRMTVKRLERNML